MHSRACRGSAASGSSSAVVWGPDHWHEADRAACWGVAEDSSCAYGRSSNAAACFGTYQVEALQAFCHERWTCWSAPAATKTSKGPGHRDVASMALPFCWHHVTQTSSVLVQDLSRRIRSSVSKGDCNVKAVNILCILSCSGSSAA